MPAMAAAVACLAFACNRESPAWVSVVVFATQEPAAVAAAPGCLVAGPLQVLGRARPPARDAAAPLAPNVVNWVSPVVLARTAALARATARTSFAMAACALPVGRQAVLVVKVVNVQAPAAATATYVLPRTRAAEPTRGRARPGTVRPAAMPVKPVVPRVELQELVRRARCARRTERMPCVRGAEASATRVAPATLVLKDAVRTASASPSVAVQRFRPVAETAFSTRKKPATMATP
jgi:hypothetical protein